MPLLHHCKMKPEKKAVALNAISKDHHWKPVQYLQPTKNWWKLLSVWDSHITFCETTLHNWNLQAVTTPCHRSCKLVRDLSLAIWHGSHLVMFTIDIHIFVRIANWIDISCNWILMVPRLEISVPVAQLVMCSALIEGSWVLKKYVNTTGMQFQQS